MQKGGKANPNQEINSAKIPGIQKPMNEHQSEKQKITRSL